MANTSVLVVGAGPAGLVMALSLAKNGIPTRIIEKSHEFHVGTRGAGVMPRSLELLQKLGVISELEKRRGIDDLPMHIYAVPGGTEVVMKTPPLVATLPPSPSLPFTKLWFISQSVMVNVLSAELAKYGVTVELGTQLVDFEQKEDKVVVNCLERTPDGVETPVQIEAKYLVGTDGAKGAVRKLLKVNFLGRTMDAEEMIVANVVVENIDLSVAHIWKTPSLFFMLRPYDEAGKKFFGIAGMSTGGDLEKFASKEGFKTIFARETGRTDLEFGEFDWISYFRPNMRMVDNFRVGRVFLAGDAAHVHSPHGGQGLNTSIQDSFNLAWKLALVDKGLAPAKLLDTYQEERMPVVTAMLSKVLGVYEEDSKGAGPPHRGKELLMQGINYRWSSIVVDSSSERDIEALKANAYLGWDGEGRPVAGDRAPDAPGLVLRSETQSGKKTLFELLSPVRHTVLVFPCVGRPVQSLEAVTAAVRRICPRGTVETIFVQSEDSEAVAGADLIVLDRDGSAREAYCGDSVRTVIVAIRPDGVIGCVGTEAEVLSKYFSLIFKD